MQKRNILDLPPGRGVSAYAFDDDPDANWSTITKPEKKEVQAG